MAWFVSYFSPLLCNRISHTAYVVAPSPIKPRFMDCPINLWSSVIQPALYFNKWPQWFGSLRSWVCLIIQLWFLTLLLQDLCVIKQAITINQMDANIGYNPISSISITNTGCQAPRFDRLLITLKLNWVHFPKSIIRNR